MTTTTFKPRLGSRIEHACVEARALAKRNCRPVLFRFNGVELVATAKRSVVSLTNEYNRRLDYDAARYHRSARGKAEEERNRLDLILRQAKLDELIDTIVHEISLGLSGVVGWLARLAEIADHIGLQWNKSAVIATLLINGGYRAREYVGAPKDEFLKREVMGRYIVGQAISCMQSGMPPHPITVDFAEKYFALT